MVRKILALLLVVVVGFWLTSCASATARKHLENANALDAQGSKLEANNEYIRALKGISDKKLRAEICQKIADNYRLAHRFEEAIKYYKESIQNYNAFHLPAPYVKLAEVYIASGQPGSASALLDELESEKPENYRNHQVEITRLLSSYYMRKHQWRRAEVYVKKLEEYGKKYKMPNVLHAAETMMNVVKRGKDRSPIVPSQQNKGSESNNKDNTNKRKSH